MGGICKWVPFGYGCFLGVGVYWLVGVDVSVAECVWTCMVVFSFCF